LGQSRYICVVQLFYSQHIVDGKILLDETESRHAVSVLRKTQGDILQVIDGKGNRYSAELFDAHKKQAKLEIRETETFPESISKLHLVVAPTKNIDRIEWLLEKSIEIGIASIQFIQCERSERKMVNRERLEKIALAACKQSLTWHFPELHDLVPFKSFIETEREGQLFIAVCEEAEADIRKMKSLDKKVYVMIGPEGDFSPNEYALAKKAGWQGISLGQKRLRTETAALVAVANINLIQSWHD